jgi:hypothetical protein
MFSMSMVGSRHHYEKCNRDLKDLNTACRIPIPLEDTISLSVWSLLWLLKLGMRAGRKRTHQAISSIMQSVFGGCVVCPVSRG